MSALWSAAEAARATGGVATGAWHANTVSIDTRTLDADALFVALEGEHRDGHAFAAEAAAKGAIVMVAREAGLAPATPRLRVDDTLEGLRALGRAGRARVEARIAAVTGSVGKTGTKEALRHVLGGQGAVHASAASYNNHWGVPLSLARMPKETRFGVFELGMNHEGEIAALATLVRPDIAVITKIAAAHLEYFGTLEKIADAKAEIFAGMTPDGIAVLPGDDPQFARLAAAARARQVRVVTFGERPGADWRLLACTATPTGSQIEAMRDGRELSFEIGAQGRHWGLNALAVLAAVEALGADPGRAAHSLARFVPPSGRGLQRWIRVPGGTALLLDESYNANPTSMRAAIEVLGLQLGRKLAVLGDMLELGPAGPNLHADLTGDLASAHVALVFTSGSLMQHLSDALPAQSRGAHASQAADLVPIVIAALRPGDVVLVKGSLGSRMKLVVDALGATATGDAS